MSKHHHNSRRSFLGKLGLGCASVGATTLLSGITNMGLLNAAAAANRTWVNTPVEGSYKALVCILLAGGNDSYNTLIPRSTTAYNEYAAVRTNLAIPRDDLLAINPTNPDGKDYGLHPSLNKVRDLFENQKLSFIANIGTLVEPTSLTDFNNSKNLPLGLFSHSDQQNHWQTSAPRDRNALGWGGKIADILHTNNMNQDISMNISLNGINLFQRGNTIQPFVIQPTDNGSVSITGSSNMDFYESLKRETLNDVLEQSYANILETAYTNSIIGAKNNSIAFSSAIANGQTFDDSHFANDPLSQRLKMVARTIAARGTLNMSNQTFFVQLGGFDTHDNIIAIHAELLTNLDNALDSFSQAMEELQVSNDVTTFTISDFARRLTSNGDGSDHGWGGHAMVMGGAVQGQRIHGQYPDLYLGSMMDSGGGRIIPTTSCDEYFAELALWFGASSGDLESIFPNINNFYDTSSTTMPIGFMM